MKIKYKNRVEKAFWKIGNVETDIPVEKLDLIPQFINNSWKIIKSDSSVIDIPGCEDQIPYFYDYKKDKGKEYVSVYRKIDFLDKSLTNDEYNNNKAIEILNKIKYKNKRDFSTDKIKPLIGQDYDGYINFYENIENLNKNEDINFPNLKDDQVYKCVINSDNDIEWVIHNPNTGIDIPTGVIINIRYLNDKNILKRENFWKVGDIITDNKIRFIEKDKSDNKVDMFNLSNSIDLKLNIKGITKPDLLPRGWCIYNKLLNKYESLKLLLDDSALLEEKDLEYILDSTEEFKKSDYDKPFYLPVRSIVLRDNERDNILYSGEDANKLDIDLIGSKYGFFWYSKNKLIFSIVDLPVDFKVFLEMYRNDKIISEDELNRIDDTKTFLKNIMINDIDDNSLLYNIENSNYKLSEEIINKNLNNKVPTNMNFSNGELLELIKNENK